MQAAGLEAKVSKNGRAGRGERGEREERKTSSRERSELSTLFLGSYKQPTTVLSRSTTG
jgi:hypothetical protein